MLEQVDKPRPQRAFGRDRRVVLFAGDLLDLALQKLDKLVLFALPKVHPQKLLQRLRMPRMLFQQLFVNRACFGAATQFLQKLSPAQKIRFRGLGLGADGLNPLGQGRFFFREVAALPGFEHFASLNPQIRLSQALKRSFVRRRIFGRTKDPGIKLDECLAQQNFFRLRNLSVGDAAFK